MKSPYAVAVTAAAAFFSSSSAWSGSPDQAPLGYVYSSSDATASGLRKGTPVLLGTKIQTGGKSEATLVLSQGSVRTALLLKPGTSLQLKRLPGGDGIEADLSNGGVLADVHNPKKVAHPFQIRTRTAVMGVRGTVFFVKAPRDHQQSVFVCTCAGEVAIAPAQGGEPVLVRSKHHDHPYEIRDGGSPIPSRLSPAPMGTDHADPDGAELERALGQVSKS
jgi:hypothetical protein